MRQEFRLSITDVDIGSNPENKKIFLVFLLYETIYFYKITKYFQKINFLIFIIMFLYVFINSFIKFLNEKNNIKNIF